MFTFSYNGMGISLRVPVKICLKLRHDSVYGFLCVACISTSALSFLSLYPVNYFFLFAPEQPLVGQGLLFIEASRSHSDTAHNR
jgi:hypothetical protein